MKYVLSHRTMVIGEYVAKIPFAKAILKHIYYPYKEWLNKKRNQQFLIYGLDVLKHFDTSLRSKNVDYVLGFGSLLGAVRNHGFLSHDMDIDTCMWADDYFDHDVPTILKDAGFDLIRSFLVDEGRAGMEVTYAYNDVSIDIFLIYPALGKYPYSCHEWSPFGDATSREESMKKYGKVIPWRFEAPYVRDTMLIDFYDTKLPIPCNYKEMLAFRYGDDFMTPKPDWVDNLINMTKWDEKAGILI